MTREFVILPSFATKWKDLEFTDDDMRRLEDELLQNPKTGQVIQGTGSLRKMRFSFENRGKRGSVRVIYIDFETYEKTFFVDVYQKSDKDNLSKEERNNLGKYAELLKISMEKGKSRK